MTNKTFFKIAGLVVFAGMVFYLVAPKYTFTADNAHIRKNKVTGSIEWLRYDETSKKSYWKST